MSANAVQTPLSDHVIGEILAQMGRRRINKAELSRRLNVLEVWVGRRLNGRVPISLDDLQRIADVLDVPAGQLMPDTRTTVVFSPGERVLATVGADRSPRPAVHRQLPTIHSHVAGRAVQQTRPLVGAALRPYATVTA